MINKVILVGNLGDAPETGETKAGHRFAKLSVATNKRWTDKATGEKRERASWHRVVVWGNDMANAAAAMAKGARIYVEGELETRKFQARDGRDQWVTEIVVQGYAGRVFGVTGGSGGGVPDPAAPPDDYRG